MLQGLILFILNYIGEKNTSCRYKRGKRARGHKFLWGGITKTVMVTEKIEGPSQKNMRGYQSKLADPLNENTEDNNTSRII